MLDPNDFIIARKRKKYRFAWFQNLKNCYELEEWKASRRDVSIDTVEVGAGTGLFLVEMAERHRNQTFLAVDVKADRLQKGARLAESKKLDNIYFVRARADQLLEVVAPKSVQSIWLTFSDPFPKKRDAKRRLTHRKYLDIYKNAHVQNGVLFIKTDDLHLFDWSLEELVADDWRILELTYDLHESDFADDYKIMTTYETRWQAEGRQTMFVSARTE